MDPKNKNPQKYMDSQMNKDNENRKKNQRENLAPIIRTILQKVHNNLKKLYFINGYL